MRSLTGLFLLLTGIAVGAHAYYPDAVERHVHIAQLARVLTPAAPYDTTAQDLQSRTVRSFSPGGQLLTTGATGSTHTIKTVEQPASPILNTAPKLVRTNGWEANIIRAAGPTEGSGRPLTDSERWRLVRDLQTELRRAGCYWGKLDGSWGAGSKYAVQEFMLQVNASLPMTEPDPIMLTLLRSHSGTVCGKSCDEGYTKSANGRCLPYAITAEKRTEPESKVVAPPARLVRSGTVDGGTEIAATVAQAPRQYPDGRMAIGGPIDQINPRYTAPGVSAEPALVRAVPRPEPRARPEYRGPSKKSKSAQAGKSKKSYRSASSAKQRRKALIRKAFGEGFD
ncbi:MAG: peptidoglycan-binding protein [Alphaproteobacteria bacterium]|nr:peptidoglycan-binding protein [Alphaproteobacteria bacterium]